MGDVGGGPGRGRFVIGIVLLVLANYLLFGVFPVTVDGQRELCGPGFMKVVPLEPGTLQGHEWRTYDRCYGIASFQLGGALLLGLAGLVLLYLGRGTLSRSATSPPGKDPPSM